MDKVLSVSIAAYNVEKYLHQCLNSFVAPQIIEGIEVIVVNDGSTDSTLEIASEYARRYPDIFSVVDKQNGGWGSTLNSAIEVARGKYFKQLDGDDYYSNENLTSFIRFLRECDSDLVITPYVEFDHTSGEIIRLVKENESIPREKVLMISDIEDELVLAMHSVTVKTNLLRMNSIKMTEHCFYTDTEFLIKTVDVSNNIILYDQPIYWYRLGNAGQSVSIEGYLKHYKDMILISNNMMTYELNKGKDYIRKVSHSWIYKHLRNTYRVLWTASADTKMKKELLDFDRFVCLNFPEYSDAAPRATKLWRKTNYKMHVFYLLLSKLRNH